ncbi:hypothetical protein [Laspinema palackyanum]|uniref:hypothetical protein n=1 Tax=Laspinema palackyanum TaxID=3231601 RepID=UPI00345DA2BA|nr:hypothetical protein [Laspinema sp. D2c]
MANLSEFEQFATRVKSLANQPVYHDEFVYPGLIVKQAGRERIQITPPLSEAVQFLQYNPVKVTTDELDLPPVTVQVARNAIHLEPLGKSMCLVTIPGNAKMQVIDGVVGWEAAIQLMSTDPDAVADYQVLLSLVFEGED